MEITDVEKQLSETIDAYEKKDGAKLKLLLNGVEEEYGNSGICVLTTQDGFMEHTELSVGIAKYLIDCVKMTNIFLHYFKNDLRELSSDIVDVYVRLLLHNEIKLIRKKISLLSQMLFEEEIDSCDDFIIDSSLLEKIHIKAKLPKEWITEYEEQLNGTSREIFRGNSLESRNKKRYDTYKTIAQIIHVGKKIF